MVGIGCSRRYPGSSAPDSLLPACKPGLTPLAVGLGVDLKEGEGLLRGRHKTIEPGQSLELRRV